MRRNKIYIILILFFVLLAAFSYLYLFNIYEVTYSVDPAALYSDNKSIVTITSDPINAFGYKIPFRYAPSEFVIKEGNDLINVLMKNNNNGILKLTAKNKTGTVTIYIKSKYALMPSSIKINILSR